MLGLGGDDVLVGGLGEDTLTGGLGADKFTSGVWGKSNSGSENWSASKAHGDVITDFSSAEGDKIDLSPTDANTVKDSGQAFTWIGGASFSNVAGELRFAGGILAGDVNGDGVADFQITLTGVTSLTSADIVL